MPRSFHARFAWPILFAAVVLSVFAGYGAWWAMQNQSNQFEDWLPAEYQETKDLHWFYQHFSGDDLLMISWDGCTLNDRRLRQLVEELRRPADINGQQDLRVFRDVITAHDVLRRLAEAGVDVSRASALRKLEGSLVGPPRSGGERTACVVVLITDLGWQHRFATIDHVFACADRVDGLAADAIHMAGPTIDGVSIDRASQQSVKRLLWLCLLVCVAITLACFRSFRLMAMVIGVAELNRVLTLALVYYTGSTMDSVLLVAPSLVSVLSVSAAVHLVNYYGDALREGGVEGAVMRAVKHGWVPCALATATTALGLLSLLVSRLQPIKNFGIFSTAGLVLGSAILFLLLPALLEMFPRRRWVFHGKQPDADAARRWRQLYSMVDTCRTPLILLNVALLAVGVWGVTRIQSTARIHDMLPAEHRVLRDYAWLERHVGPLVPLEIVLLVAPPAAGPGWQGYPMLQRLRLVQRVEQIAAGVDGVNAAVSAATFAPPLRRRRETVGWRTVINKRLTAARPNFVEAEMLCETEEADLWRISARVRASERHDYVALQAELKRRIGDYLASRDNGAARVRSVVYSGSVPIVQKSQQQVLTDLYASFTAAFVLIAAAMMLLLRNAAAGLVSMIPNLLPAIVVFGALGWLGMPIEIGSMMTATVAMGIAVDDTLHFLTWFRRGLSQGMSRGEGVLFAYGNCGLAMIQTSLICGLGLLVFVASEFQPISRFAWLMFSMLAVALFGDLLVLPALLTSPLGLPFEPRRRSSKDSAE